MQTANGPIARHIPSGSRANEKKLGAWKPAVAAAFAAAPRSWPSGPVAVGIVFILPLRAGDLDPRGAPKASAPIAPEVKPDTDKLLRATLDALTSAGAWRDDA